MRTQRSCVPFKGWRGPAHFRRQGSALLIVLVLLSLMGALAYSNAIILRRVEAELRLLEQKQVHALEKVPSAGMATSTTNTLRQTERSPFGSQ